MSKQVQHFVNAVIETAVVENNVGYVRTDRKFIPVVEQVIDAVETQGEKIADAIRGKAQEVGLSESEVENFLIQIGLSDEPEPEPEPVTLESLAERQAKSEALLQEILNVAKRYAPRHFENIG